MFHNTVNNVIIYLFILFCKIPPKNSHSINIYIYIWCITSNFVNTLQSAEEFKESLIIEYAVVRALLAYIAGQQYKGITPCIEYELVSI